MTYLYPFLGGKIMFLLSFFFSVKTKPLYFFFPFKVAFHFSIEVPVIEHLSENSSHWYRIISNGWNLIITLIFWSCIPLSNSRPKYLNGSLMSPLQVSQSSSISTCPILTFSLNLFLFQGTPTSMNGFNIHLMLQVVNPGAILTTFLSLPIMNPLS